MVPNPGSFCTAYDASFMNVAILKACNFYFDKFLPSVVPYIIITPVDTLHPSTCEQVNISESVMPTIDSPIFSTTARVPMTIATPDVQFIGSHKYKSSTSSFDMVLKDLNVKSAEMAAVYTTQAGLISKDSRDDRNIS